jgi:hypothetical protein
VGGTGGALKRERGAWAGVVAEKPRDVHGAHAPVHGGRREGGSNKAGPQRRERKEDTRGQRLGTNEPGPRDREGESERAKETSADRLTPLGSEREREGEHEGEPSLIGGVRLSGGAGMRPGWA